MLEADYSSETVQTKRYFSVVLEADYSSETVQTKRYFSLVLEVDYSSETVRTPTRRLRKWSAQTASDCSAPPGAGSVLLCLSSTPVRTSASDKPVMD